MRWLHFALVEPTFQAAPGVLGIDTRMTGRAVVTSAYLIPAREPALIETGPTTSVDSVTLGLRTLGIEERDLAHIVVTYIHLDHAGGVGTLAARFPNATVWAHERGAPHLQDPTKLLASAARVYGEQRLRGLFGAMDPVPAERLRAVTDGDTIGLGDRNLEVLYTPGHASHHVSLVDSGSGALWTGDALGIHLPDVGVLRPATPPPDIDLDTAIASIERIRRSAPPVLMFSHYGPVAEVDEICELATSRWRKWAGIVRDALDESAELERVTEILRDRTASEFEDAVEPSAAVERYEVLSSMEMNAAGFMRYWQKREERERRGGPQPAS